MEWIILFFGLSLGVALGVWVTSFWSPQHRQNRELELALRQKVAELEAKTISLEAERYQMKGRLLALQADLTRREAQIASLKARLVEVQTASGSLLKMPANEQPLDMGREKNPVDGAGEAGDGTRLNFWTGHPFPRHSKTKFARAGRSEMSSSDFTCYTGL